MSNYCQKLFKVFFLVCLLTIVKGNILDGRPDALRCSLDISKGSSIFFAHSISTVGTSHYHQVYAGEIRSLFFNSNGSYNSGGGHFGSIAGCVNKSLNELQVENRTIYFASKGQVNYSVPNSSPSFWDYEQIKQLWYEQFKQKMLGETKKLFEQWEQKLKNEIKTKTLLIGERWMIRQQSTDFVIRDVEGSKIRDSRMTFPPMTTLDLK